MSDRDNHSALDNRNRLTPEYRWVVDCLSSWWDPPALDGLAHGGAVDYQAVLDLSLKERVSPILYALCRDTDLLPPGIQTRLRQLYYLTARRNTLLLDELGDILDELQSAGVPVILLKGAALAEPIYANPAVRPMTDLDFLLPLAKLDLARAVFFNRGYAASSFEPWPGFNQRYRHAIEFQKPVAGGQNYSVDLHWAVVDVPFYRGIAVEDWLTRAQPVRIADTEAFIPAPEDHFIALCAHLAFHERYQKQLIRNYDLAMLIHASGDNFSWGSVIKHAEEWQLVLPLQRAQARLDQLWPEIVPTTVAQQVTGLVPSASERCIHRWVVDRKRNPTSDVLFSLVTLPGLGKKAQYFLEQAFPSPTYMRGLYCQQRSYLWPIAYLLRAALTLRDLLVGLLKRPA